MKIKTSTSNFGIDKSEKDNQTVVETKMETKL